MAMSTSARFHFKLGARAALRALCAAVEDTGQSSEDDEAEKQVIMDEYGLTEEQVDGFNLETLREALLPPECPTVHAINSNY